MEKCQLMIRDYPTTRFISLVINNYIYILLSKFYSSCKFAIGILSQTNSVICYEVN